MAHLAMIPSPLGMLGIAVSKEGSLCRIEFPLKGYKREAEASLHGKNQSVFASGCGGLSGKTIDDVCTGNPVMVDVVAQLDRYFEDPQWCFKLPLTLGGTPFQRRVWRALQSIPPGETVAYGTLANALGTSARAVGNACRANPIPIIIPCHRVVGAHDTGGFMGSRTNGPLAIKRWLLMHEIPSKSSKKRRVFHA
uniref:methylated-DNA--[protein]-cysteine S-methyltransferase n=1 Tax=Candidatus Kentrum sp. FW TaxID=2126338 RepID=A0A450S0R7_9GAMM|nr:MAG: O-6-methylguanine DNA methyltransferase [Candidatus Kentron sp. FW]